MDELDEEHGSEGGYLEGAKNDKGKITKAGILTQIRDVNLDTEATDDERIVLNSYLALMENESATNKKIQEALKVLDNKVSIEYKTLSEDEVKTLTVDDKWLNTLSADVQSELERTSQVLTDRIKELAERYVAPLPAIVGEVVILNNKVEAQLKRMGFIWN
jgi:type I restriction enzyme M protein